MSYIKIRENSFGWALEMLKQNHRVARKGWNGKGMWLALSQGYKGLDEANVWNEHNKEVARLNGGTIDVLPYISLKTPDHKIVCGWKPSNLDMFAEDWYIVA